MTPPRAAPERRFAIRGKRAARHRRKHADRGGARGGQRHVGLRAVVLLAVWALVLVRTLMGVVRGTIWE
ncbi:hypothetical protein [Leucobacter sp. W1038]|uniref:hypothetical protein n=1 Tax=Leucobacter sp. W1038 TaxID=3438281 RepID=UPI003D97F46C